MSSAAQPIGSRSRLVGSPHRTVAVLRHLALRGAAFIYLGALVVVPVAGDRHEGVRRWVRDLHARDGGARGHGRRSG